MNSPLLAAMPTVIVGLGEARRAFLGLANELDDGLDIDEERGFRLLLEKVSNVGASTVEDCPRADVAERVAELLAALLTENVGRVVSSVAGLRLMIACGAADLKVVPEILRAVHERVEKPMGEIVHRQTGGVQVCVVVRGLDLTQLEQQWPDDVELSGDRRSTVAGITLPYQHGSTRLTEDVLDAAVSLALRVLLFEATSSAQSTLGIREGKRSLQAWYPSEVLDESVTLASEARLARFAAWVALIQSATGSEPPECPALARMQRGTEHSAQLESSERLGLTAMETLATKAAEGVAERLASPDLAKAPGWEADVETALVAALTTELRHAGEDQARKWLEQNASVLSVDTKWFTGLHQAMGACGTGALLRELEDLRRKLGDARASLPRPPGPVEGSDEKSGLSGLAGLRRQATDTLAEPPNSMWHWLGLVFAVLGLATTPIWQGLAAKVGPAQPAIHNLLQRGLHHAIWYTCNDAGAVAVGLLAGLGLWAGLRAAETRRWLAARDQWCDAVRSTLTQAAQASGGLLAREKFILQQRVVSARLGCADAVLQHVQQQIQGVEETNRMVSWLVRRLQRRRASLLQVSEWTSAMAVSGLRWQLVPPLDKRDEQATSTDASPWHSGALKFDPWASAQATEFFLHPNQVLGAYREVAHDDRGSLVGARLAPAPLNAVAGRVRFLQPMASAGEQLRVAWLRSDALRMSQPEVFGDDGLKSMSPVHGELVQAQHRDRFLQVARITRGEG